MGNEPLASCRTCGDRRVALYGAAMQMTGKQRRFLRALAHSLDPIVQIGKSGLTDGVGSKLDEVLEVHELIKVKLGRECPLDLDEASAEIERVTGGSVAQTIGRTLVVYRAKREDPRIDLERLCVREVPDAARDDEREQESLSRKRR